MNIFYLNMVNTLKEMENLDSELKAEIDKLENKILIDDENFKQKINLKIKRDLSIDSRVYTTFGLKCYVYNFIFKLYKSDFTLSISLDYSGINFNIDCGNLDSKSFDEFSDIIHNFKCGEISENIREYMQIHFNDKVALLTKLKNMRENVEHISNLRFLLDISKYKHFFNNRVLVKRVESIGIFDFDLKINEEPYYNHHNLLIDRIILKVDYKFFNINEFTNPLNVTYDMGKINFDETIYFDDVNAIIVFFNTHFKNNSHHIMKF